MIDASALGIALAVDVRFVPEVYETWLHNQGSSKNTSEGDRVSQ